MTFINEQIVKRASPWTGKFKMEQKFKFWAVLYIILIRYHHHKLWIWKSLQLGHCFMTSFVLLVLFIISVYAISVRCHSSFPNPPWSPNFIYIHLFSFIYTRIHFLLLLLLLLRNVNALEKRNSPFDYKLCGEIKIPDNFLQFLLLVCLSS